jgi:hypothetical protein
MNIIANFLFRADLFSVLTLVQLCQLRLTEHAERMGITETDFGILSG